MRPTEHEMAAAGRLADALVRFLHAIEDGAARRRAGRPGEHATVRREQPPPPTPAPPGLPDRLLVTPGEAAELLSVSGRTLWALTAPRRPIPAVRLGRLVRYPVDGLSQAISRMKSRR
jgi:excisionase family DNA binding protein